MQTEHLAYATVELCCGSPGVACQCDSTLFSGGTVIVASDYILRK